jgi:DNA-binding transcriptional LysR family regulator
MARDELKLMEAAIALAEELSFSRAARKLRISQPTLTKYIAELEERLGILLFERDRRTVVLTEKGRAYIAEARLAVLHGKRATQAARTAGEDLETVLNFGRSPHIDPFLISTLLAVRLPLHPHLRIELSSRLSSDLVHDVLAGSLDLAMVIDATESPLLSMLEVTRSPFYITMAEHDDLAKRDSLTLDAMDGREWVLFERQVHPQLYDSILRAADARQIVPAKMHHVMTAEEAFPFISQGALAFLTKSGALRLTSSIAGKYALSSNVHGVPRR